ncbi:MAG: hypothetical protein ACYC2G_05550 [Gemmatimonadaceae bacterium]
MPIREPGHCPHEPRPGTVVCLYCRHEEHVAGAERRWARGGVVGAALLACIAVGGYLIGGRGDATADPDSAALSTATTSAALVVSSTPAPPRPDASSLSLGSTSVASAAEPASAQPTPVLAGPIVAEGRTALPGGLFVVRTGDTVYVHFDTPTTRTRRPEKFERIVRETLPAVYGALADDALAGIPAGQLVASGELLDGLPERGVRLPTAEGGTLMLWPSTRPGRDGPLVVTYRATILQ